MNSTTRLFLADCFVKTAMPARLGRMAGRGLGRMRKTLPGTTSGTGPQMGGWMADVVKQQIKNPYQPFGGRLPQMGAGLGFPMSPMQSPGMMSRFTSNPWAMGGAGLGIGGGAGYGAHALQSYLNQPSQGGFQQMAPR